MPDDIKKQLQAIFETEAHFQTELAKKKARKHANKLKNSIARDSPVRKNGGAKKGKYKKGWQAKVEAEDEFGIRIVVRQKNRSEGGEPSLPHLLENGHKQIVRHKDGSYSISEKTPHVDGIPHIKDNAEAEIAAFYEDCRKGH